MLLPFKVQWKWFGHQHIVISKVLLALRNGKPCIINMLIVKQRMLVQVLSSVALRTVNWLPPFIEERRSLEKFWNSMLRLLTVLWVLECRKSVELVITVLLYRMGSLVLWSCLLQILAARSVPGISNLLTNSFGKFLGPSPLEMVVWRIPVSLSCTSCVQGWLGCFHLCLLVRVGSCLMRVVQLRLLTWTVCAFSVLGVRFLTSGVWAWVLPLSGLDTVWAFRCSVSRLWVLVLRGASRILLRRFTRLHVSVARRLL